MSPFRLLLGSVVLVVLGTTGAYFLIAPAITASNNSHTALLSKNEVLEDVLVSTKTISSTDGVVDGPDLSQEVIREEGNEEAEDDVVIPSSPKSVGISTTPKQTTQQTTPPPLLPSPSGYTREEVSVHNSKKSCWTIVNGSVYDITSYVSHHPGGERKILKICGIDGTALFEEEHGGESKPEAKLASLRIGALIK